MLGTINVRAMAISALWVLRWRRKTLLIKQNVPVGIGKKEGGEPLSVPCQSRLKLIELNSTTEPKVEITPAEGKSKPTHQERPHRRK